MSVKYGRGATRIRNSDVLATYSNNMTNITSGDVNGYFEWYGTNVYGGCGNANGDAGVLIVIKNDISWNRVTCQFEFDGNASCWTFLGGGSSTNSPQNTPGGGYGRSGPNVPGAMTSSSIYNIDGPGNIYQYNENSGDRIFYDVNAFSDSANFIRKAHACDNDNTNMFHGGYNDAGYKSFWTTRRRVENGNPGGVWHGRSCASTGKYIRIKNIFVWYEG